MRYYMWPESSRLIKLANLGNVLNNKSNEMHYFGKELYMFRTDLPSIIRSLNTV